ncbi:MAG: hypothetical protein HY293_15310 [Planctomycetes bacterium]|nr:hypothetical protein [Planctomycetota bacterium]
MGMRSGSGLWLLLGAGLLLAGTLGLVFGVLPLAACPTCDGKGKYLFLFPEDVVLDPGGKQGDEIRKRKVEHRPAYSIKCERCRGRGRMTLFQKWTGRAPAQGDAALLELEPEGPITTTEELPVEPPPKKSP